MRNPKKSKIKKSTKNQKVRVPRTWNNRRRRRRRQRRRWQKQGVLLLAKNRGEKPRRATGDDPRSRLDKPGEPPIALGLRRADATTRRGWRAVVRRGGAAEEAPTKLAANPTAIVGDGSHRRRGDFNEGKKENFWGESRDLGSGFESPTSPPSLYMIYANETRKVTVPLYFLYWWWFFFLLIFLIYIYSILTV